MNLKTTLKGSSSNNNLALLSNKLNKKDHHNTNQFERTKQKSYNFNDKSSLPSLVKNNTNEVEVLISKNSKSLIKSLENNELVKQSKTFGKNSYKNFNLADNILNNINGNDAHPNHGINNVVNKKLTPITSRVAKQQNSSSSSIEDEDKIPKNNLVNLKYSINTVDKPDKELFEINSLIHSPPYDFKNSTQNTFRSKPKKKLSSLNVQEKSENNNESPLKKSNIIGNEDILTLSPFIKNYGNKKNSDHIPKIDELILSKEIDSKKVIHKDIVEVDSKKKKGKSRSLSYNEPDAETDYIKPKTPKKQFKNISCISYKSLPGKINSFQSKINQDSFLIITNILGIAGFCLFGVFDGHGTVGHLVSDFCKKFFEVFFTDKENYKSLNKDDIYESLVEHEYSIIKNAFNHCEKALGSKDLKFDTTLSGTTANIVISIGNKIICANSGDSRAIFSGKGGVKQLSFDHKPENYEEKQRITKAGGRVTPIKENGKYVGPYRVWVKNSDYPGLAMSRSLGDFVAKSCGCTHVPGNIFF